MAKIVRYDGNLKAFASEQQTNERTLFGEVAIANDLTSQITAQFLRGWGIVGPSDQPSLQDFNAVGYTLGQLLAYLHQMGVAEYNAAQEYFIGSFTQTGGVLYMSLADANIGNTPSLSPASWKAFTADQATEVAIGLVKIATQALTNGGSDDLTAVTPKKLAVATQGQKHTAFSSTGSPTAQILTPIPAISAYAPGLKFSVTFNVASGVNPSMNISGRGDKLLKQYDASGAKVAATFGAGQISDVAYDGVDLVLLNKGQSAIQATETVLGSARVATQALTNAGVDDSTIVTPKKMRFGFLISLTANGYIMFPSWMSGLIIQWGLSAQIPNNTTISVPLPMAYPTACLWASAVASNPGSAQAGADAVPNIASLSTTAISIFANDNAAGTTALPGVYYASIGH